MDDVIWGNEYYCGGQNIRTVDIVYIDTEFSFVPVPRFFYINMVKDTFWGRPLKSFQMVSHSFVVSIIHFFILIKYCFVWATLAKYCVV